MQDCGDVVGKPSPHQLTSRTDETPQAANRVVGGAGYRGGVVDRVMRQKLSDARRLTRTSFRHFYFAVYFYARAFGVAYWETGDVPLLNRLEMLSGE